MSSLPRKSALPPRRTAAVSAASRVRVERLENSSAIDLLKRDWEGMRNFLLVRICGWSHGVEKCLRFLAWLRICFICGAERSASVIKWGIVLAIEGKEE